MYMQYTGSSIEEFSKTFRPQAEQQVKMRLALEKIVELEKIVPSAEELEAKIEEMAKGYGVTADQVKAAIPMDDISLDLAVSKAIDLIKDNAVITDVKEKTEKKPAAKKTTTKKAAADGEKKPAAKKTTTKKAATDGEKKPAAKKTTTKKAAADKE